MAKTTTLADVAKRIGVAPSTVQRALNGSAGVSEKRRKEIQAIAKEMGYQRNIMATMLKADSPTIAVILPEMGYYSSELWKGVQNFFSENAGYGFTVLHYPYQRTEEQFKEVLEKVYNEHGDHLSGVLTMGEKTEPIRAIYQRWQKASIPVVFIGTDSFPEDRLCCCSGNDELAGQLAADMLLFSSLEQDSMKILITGDFSIADQYHNMIGFENSILRQSKRYEILKYGDRADQETVQKILENYLTEHTNITAVYSTSARNTISLCKAAKKVNLSKTVRLIGSDLFPETSHYLEDGTLHAVIHKRPSRQAYLAAQVLQSYILQNKRPENIIRSNPVIIMKSNINWVETII